MTWLSQLLTQSATKKVDLLKRDQQFFSKRKRQSFVFRKSSLLQLLIPALLLFPAAFISGEILIPQAAQANCAGAGRPAEAVDREVLQRWNSIKDDRSYFWGQQILGQIRDRRLILTPAFDRLTGPEKLQVISTLQLDGSSYTVHTADGRLLSAQYDGCTPRSPLLTERDRYGWYLTRPPINAPLPVLAEALRNAGQPGWRTVQSSINPETERRVRLQFWHTVGYAQYERGWWIAWVPEGGYFEITVVNADDLSRIQSFLATASRTHRYGVIAKDGTPLSDTRYSRGNPWQWILGQTTTPDEWQVAPCQGEAPFLCVSNNGQMIGSVELQRWDIERMPQFFKDLQEQGLTPGLITYDNPNDRAKVLTALRGAIANYYQSIRSDRTTTYGDRYRMTERPPQAAQVGRLPGLSYGFSGTSNMGEILEQYSSYIAFDGSRYLYIIVTGSDPAAETSTFENLSDLNQFEPHLQQIIANLNLPHPDW